MMMSDRTSAIEIARTKIKLKPLYLDTETTGTDQGSEIIEISIIDDDEFVRYETLIKPTRSIPRDAIRIHGITDEMLVEAPSWKTAWPQIEACLQKNPVGIYNSEFDLRMMQQTHARYWMRWDNLLVSQVFCIMRLYAQFYGEWNRARGTYRWHSLDMAGRQSGITLPHAHRAREDALLARAVLHYIADST